MAEEQLPYTEINATLTNILSELKGQKRELSSIKEDDKRRRQRKLFICFIRREKNPKNSERFSLEIRGK